MSQPQSATESDWIRATGFKVFVGRPCSACRVAGDRDVCNLYDPAGKGTKQCPLARKVFLREYRGGKRVIKGKPHLDEILKRRCVKVGESAQVRLEVAKATADGRVDEARALTKEWDDLWKQISQAGRECGISEHIRGSQEEPYDSALFAG